MPVAVSLKLSRLFSLKFFQAFKKKLYLQVLFYCQLLSVFGFQIVFFKSLFAGTKLWNSLTYSNQINWKNRFVRDSMSMMIHQWVPFLSKLSIFLIIKGYFPYFLISLFYIHHLYLRRLSFEVRFQSECFIFL